MSINACGWDYGRWGETLRWGIRQIGVLGTATRITTEITDMLYQSTPTLAMVDVSITIGGVDVSAYVESYRVTLRGTGRWSDAQAVLLAGHGATLTTGSAFVVTITYTTALGATQSFTRFRGTVASAGTTGEASGTREAVVAMDIAAVLAGRDRDYTAFGSGSYSTSGLYSELASNGIGFSGSVYSVQSTGIEVTAYKSTLDFILGMANILGPCLCYFDSNNVLRALSQAASGAASVTITAAAQADHKSSDGGDSRINQILVVMEKPDSTTAVTWGEFTGSYVTGGFRVQNLADQAKWGVQASEIRPAFTPQTTYKGFLLGALTSGNTLLPTYTWKAVLNAMLYPTVVATLTLPSGSAKTVAIEEVTDSGSPGNHWSSVSARAVWA